MSAYKSQASYELPTPCHVAGQVGFLLEQVDFEFPAGKVIPKSEQEEAALELLVSQGVAERVEPKESK
jgi:hypothetical protein